MIKGLKPKLAEGGKIKIGGKGEARKSRSGGTYRVPQKHDHFTITTTQREGGSPDGDLIRDDRIMGLLASDYSDQDGKIRTLPIVLHSDDIDLVFPTAYVSYTGRSVFCRGDGETAERRVLDNGGNWQGEIEEVTCPCERLQRDAKGVQRCKYSGTLHCSLRVPGQAVAGAVHRWRTTSQISCEQMYGSLLQITETVGVLRGLPLVLRVRPVNVDPVGGRPSTVYVCHVELRADDLQTVQRQALELAQMRGALSGQIAAAQESNYRAMLQAPGTGTAEELTDEGEEFYPDAVIDSPMAAAMLPSPTEPQVLDAPLAGLGLAGPAVTGGDDTDPPAPLYDAPTPPAAPAAPPPPAEPPKRTRRTTCKGCGEKFGPGIVVKGLCEQCRAPAPVEEHEETLLEMEAETARREAAEPPAMALRTFRPSAPPTSASAPDPAPEIVATPHQRLQAMVRAAVVDKGIDQAIVLGAIAKAWPDYETKTAEATWTHDDIGLMEGILGGIGA